MRRPRRATAGFTFLELLFVIISVGVLASIAISHFVDVRIGQYRDAAKAELQRVADAQRTYLAANGRYAADLASLGYTPPGQVKVALGGAGVSTGAGWNATAEHTAFPGARCFIGVGSDTVAGQMKTRSGVVTCPEEREE